MELEELTIASNAIALLQSQLEHARRELVLTRIALVDAAGGEIRVPLSVLQNVGNRVVEFTRDLSTDEIVYRTRSPLPAETAPLSGE